MKEMVYKKMLITPEIAKEFLATSEFNRTLNKNVVDTIAKDIKNGGWELTHQGIAFDENSRLVDGHHRLNAIVKAGIPVNMMVAFNAPRSTKLDVGYKRTTSQQLYMAGVIEKGSNESVSFMNAITVYMVLRALGDRASRLLTADNKHNLYQVYKKELDFVIELARKTNGGVGKSAPVLYAMMCAYCAGTDPEIIKKWFYVLITGDFYVENDDALTKAGRSILNLRDLIISRKGVSNTIIKDEICKKSMNSIFNYALRKPIQKVYATQVYPELTVTEEMLLSDIDYPLF